MSIEDETAVCWLLSFNFHLSTNILWCRTEQPNIDSIICTNFGILLLSINSSNCGFVLTTRSGQSFWVRFSMCLWMGTVKESHVRKKQLSSAHCFPAISQLTLIHDIGYETEPIIIDN